MSKRIQIANELLLDEVSRLIAEGHSTTLRVKGNSMRPFLIGNKDKVRLTKAIELHKYDIVLAKIEQRYVLHRIIKLDNHRITLMGDGNLVGKEYCTTKDIVAIVTHRIRNEKEQKISLFRSKIWVNLLFFRRILLHLFQ